LIVPSAAWLAGQGRRYADSRVTVDAARRTEAEIHAAMRNWLAGTLAKDDAILAEPHAPKRFDNDFAASIAKDEAWLAAHPAPKR
jgi:hypothetical protein